GDCLILSRRPIRHPAHLSEISQTNSEFHSPSLLIASFAFAHLARCAAAIFLRDAADIVRLTGVNLGVGFDWLFILAHRALCARAIRRRAASETVRLAVVLMLLFVLPANDS